MTDKWARTVGFGDLADVGNEDHAAIGPFFEQFFVRPALGALIDGGHRFDLGWLHQLNQGLSLDCRLSPFCCRKLCKSLRLDFADLHLFAALGLFAFRAFVYGVEPAFTRTKGAWHPPRCMTTY